MSEVRVNSVEGKLVQEALLDAAEDDAVILGEGKTEWTECVEAPEKRLKIFGAGPGRTVIIDAVPKERPWPALPNVFSWKTKAGGLSQLAGIEFLGGSIPDPNNKPLVYIAGASRQFRANNLRIAPSPGIGSGMWVSDVLGVLDHIVYDCSNLRIGLYTFHGHWNGVGEYGDASWAEDALLGSFAGIYVEDSEFLNDQRTKPEWYGCDGWNGARTTYRRNKFRNCTLANHGTDSGGRWRGARVTEAYENDFYFRGPAAVASCIGSRGGLLIAHNNRVHATDGAFVPRVVDLQYYRSSEPNKPYSPWGPAGGSSPWDENARAGGHRCLDQPGAGRGTLLSGYEPTPVGWPRQATEKNHAWNNTINGAPSEIVSNATVVVLGRDYENAALAGYVPAPYPHALVSGAPQEPPAPTPPPNPPPAPQPPPTQPPAPAPALRIVNVMAVSSKPARAVVTWTTNLPSSSQVVYGLGTALNSITPKVSNPVTWHSISLSDLKRHRTYGYQVISVDAAGNEARSAIAWFEVR